MINDSATGNNKDPRLILLNEYFNTHLIDPNKAIHILESFTREVFLKVIIRDSELERSLKFFYPETTEIEIRRKQICTFCTSIIYEKCFDLLLYKLTGQIISANSIDEYNKIKNKYDNIKETIGYVYKVIKNNINRLYQTKKKSDAQKKDPINNRSEHLFDLIDIDIFACKKQDENDNELLEEINSSSFKTNVKPQNGLDFTSYKSGNLDKSTEISLSNKEHYNIAEIQKMKELEDIKSDNVKIGDIIDDIFDEYLKNTKKAAKENLFFSINYFRPHDTKNNKNETNEKKDFVYFNNEYLEDHLMELLFMFRDSRQIICDSWKFIKPKRTQQSIKGTLTKTVKYLTTCIEKNFKKHELNFYLEEFSPLFYKKFLQKMK